MPITAENILAHEWIGLQVTVKETTDPKMRGLSGPIRNETRNTLAIEDNGRMVTISKPHTIFLTTLPTGQAVIVDGDLLRHRPEDRVKKGLTRW